MELIENLEDYMHEFFGYGNLNSKIWFIGHEEGSVQNSVSELHERVKTWNKLGKGTLCDCKDFHMLLKMGNEKPFTKGSPQRTWWRYLDILFLYSKRYVLDKELKRKFIKNEFAKLDSNHALLELFPIPCSKIPSWTYNTLEKQLDYFSSKEKYSNEVSKKRLNKILELINKHKPKCIIFSGTTALSSWQNIAGNEFKKITIGDNYYYFLKGDINYFVIPKLIYNSNAIINSVADDVRQIMKKI